MILESYKNVALDLDDTLIGNNPKKGDLWKFVINNHETHGIYIITFRQGDFLGDAWRDLNRGTGGLLKRHMFKGIYGTTPKMHNNANMFMGLLKFSREKIQTIPSFRGLNWNELEEDYKRYLEFKGRQAWITDCGVLVDDRKSLVIDGCRKYNIDYIHPLEI